MIKIIKPISMPTKTIHVADVLQVFHKEDSPAFLEFTVSDNNTLIIREPEIEDDLTTFFSEITLDDWLKIKDFVNRHLNR